MSRARATASAFLLLLTCASLAAQEGVSGLGSVRVERMSAQGGLDRALRAAAAGGGVTWVVYEVPAVPGHDGGCCYRSGEGDESCCHGCVLEEGRRGSTSAFGGAPERLEQAGVLRVFVRLEAGAISRVKALAGSCPVDASGADRLVWLHDVAASESVARLAAWVLGDEALPVSGSGVDDGAMAALALHAHADAYSRLAEWARGGLQGRAREQSIFWLGAARGARSVPLLSELATGDASDDVRERAIFALHVTKRPEAIDTLIDVARDGSSRQVRGRALFWLAHSAGERAVATLQAAVVNDPDEKIKEQAVFALSQLPAERGVPLLIEVARTNPLASVRKRAIFWLGQSDDPRAFEFIVGLLER